MQKRMVVFFDIDGTLLPEGAPAVPESTVRAIRAAQANGHLAVINSGRTMANIDGFLRDVGFDGIVSGCGLMGTLHGETVWQHPIDHGAAERVIEAARACGVTAIYEGYEALAFDTFAHPPLDVQKTHFSWLREKGKTIRVLGEHDRFPLVKFIIDRNLGGDFDRFCAMVREFVCMRFSARWEECVPIGVTKGIGIVRMMEHLGLPLSQSIAVGDSPNDMPMFTVCPNSVAMGGSPAADFPVSYVTRSIEEDGIAHMLRHFGLC